MNGSITNKLAGVVILYNPASQITLENILSYSAGLKKLYILDNSEQQHAEWELLSKQIGDHVEYIYYGSNEGISKRLNTAAHKAIQEGFEYLLTMDQDSSFPEGAFDKFLNEIENCSIQHVAQFGVNSDPVHLKESAVPLVIDSLITSGTILNLSVFKLVGAFDEKLFIDFVDVEYSLRCACKGYVNVMFLNVIMNHSIGFKKMGRSFKNFKKTPRILHAPIRAYYIIRNGLYLLFKVKHVSKEAKHKILFQHMKLLKNDFLYNDRLIDVYKYALLGVYDFLKNKMGKKV
jgi:rhamnosyltransferase